ncbi:hypothetical protein TSUD_199010 [Trifolium subterraneum]|uniref:Uncharacterized protein n=1 Tax=Trifolium subterraneum TaxID=3900 RepID=A0A2Z6LMC7_TRISU|nr:hypothetical protein TSUD_199010 [Trifolium subterraneum]
MNPNLPNTVFSFRGLTIGWIIPPSSSAKADSLLLLGIKSRPTLSKKKSLLQELVVQQDLCLSNSFSFSCLSLPYRCYHFLAAGAGRPEHVVYEASKMLLTSNAVDVDEGDYIDDGRPILPLFSF